MDDARAMRGREPLPRVAHHGEREIGRHRVLAFQVVVQRLAAQGLGDDVRAPLQFAVAQHLDDVRMVEPHEELGLALEARVRLLRLHVAGREELHDDRRLGFHFLGEVDARRRALVDEALDLISPPENRAGHGRHLVMDGAHRDRLSDGAQRFAVPGAMRPGVVHLPMATRTLHVRHFHYGKRRSPGLLAQVSSSMSLSTLRNKNSFPFWWWCLSARTYLCSCRRKASSTSASVRGAASP